MLPFQIAITELYEYSVWVGMAMRQKGLASMRACVWYLYRSFNQCCSIMRVSLLLIQMQRKITL